MAVRNKRAHSQLVGLLQSLAIMELTSFYVWRIVTRIASLSQERRNA